MRQGEVENKELEITFIQRRVNTNATCMLLLTVDMVGQCLARHWVMPSIHRTGAVGSEPIEIGFARHVGRAQPIDDDVYDVLNLLSHRARLRLLRKRGRDASQEGNQEHGGSARCSTATPPSLSTTEQRYTSYCHCCPARIAVPAGAELCL